MKPNKKKQLKIKHLIDQTVFVENLLKNDRKMEYLNNLKNINVYKAKLKDRTFEGTDVHLATEIKNLHKQLEESNDANKEKEIRESIFTLENSYQGEKIVAYWYAVPYWVSKYLEANGEVILYAHDACWLGVTETKVVKITY